MALEVFVPSILAFMGIDKHQHVNVLLRIHDPLDMHFRKDRNMSKLSQQKLLSVETLWI